VSSEEPILLRENELDNVEDDEFDHTAYVDTLERVIAEAGPPWHIGLFGTWGTGKSSIVNLLYNRINGDTQATGSDNSQNHDFEDTIGVTINAWEHSGESIRTSLLLDLNRELDKQIGSDSPDDDEEWGLLNSEEIMRELYDVEEEEEVTEQQTAVDAAKGVSRKLGGVALAVLLVIVGLVYFTPVTTIQLGMATLAGGVLLAAFRYTYSQYRDERVSRQRTMVNPRNEWTGAYADIYESILDEAQEEFRSSETHTGKLQHIVITIDDLDRCESASVYETLIALKSFMEHDLCTYIIPCDEESLYRHVQAADTGEYLDQRENQQHFLAKFFETRLRIPEIESNDLETYAIEQNKSISNKLPESVITDVVMAANPTTPRRITRAINRITTYRVLAESREFAAIDTNSKDDLKMLAKISILQEDYPRFYTALERSEITLETIYAARSESTTDGRSAISTLLDDIGIPDEDQAGLIDFLVATHQIDQDQDPEPYIRLSGSRLSTRERFENALVQGRTADLEELVTTANKQTEKEFVDAIRTALGDQETKYRVFRATLQILEAFEDEQRESIATALYNLLETEDHGMLLEDIELDQLRPCIERLDETERTMLLAWYVDTAVSAEGVQTENLHALLAMSPDELEILYEVRDRFARNMAAARDAGTITKARYDEIVDAVCQNCPQLYSEQLVREGIA
jgi:hypothetical protein